MSAPATLDLTADVVALTAQLIDIPSVSHSETALADAVAGSVSALPHLEVVRQGNCVVARTNLGRAERVLLGGHLDTVPAQDNLAHRLEGGRLYGLGSADMKGGVAVALRLAADLVTPSRDVTYVFYDCEEVEARFNGLARLAATTPELLLADLAILLEPSNAGIEGGCQGTLRVEVTTRGERAHSARAWLGDNAIHRAAEVLTRLAEYTPRRPVVDGLEYREGLSAVGIRGWVAGNVIPDECVVTVNYRFAPDMAEAEAIAHMHEVFAGFDLTVVDSAPGARPGLDLPAAAEFVTAIGQQPRPKYGWTDVARFSALGIPALNFGPGDPAVAHTREEFVPVAELRSCEERLRGWLTGG